MKRYTKILMALSSAFLLSGSVLSSVGVAQQQRDELATAMALGIGDNVLWKDLQNRHQRDMLYEPVSSNESLVYKDESITLFVTRAGKLYYSIGDMINLDAVESIANQALISLFVDTDAHDGEEDTVAAEYASAFRANVEQITFQEHRAGAVLAKEWIYDRLYLSARTWVGVAERNYWLDDEYRQNLANVTKQLFPSNDGVFNLSDFIKTSWGLGDTHLKAGWITPFDSGFTIRAGVKAIIPTAAKSRRPTDLKLIPLRMDEFQGYGKSRLNEILIAPKLGNGGHVGGGIWGDATWTQAYDNGRQVLKVQAYGGVDYLIDATEERALLQYVDTTMVRASGGLATTYAGLADVFKTSHDSDFRNFITQHALPELIEVVVAPGAIAQLGLLAQYSFGKALFFAGYDWYFKSQEKIVRFVEASDAMVYSPVQEASPSSSNQQKIFGGISYSVMQHDVQFFSRKFSNLGLSFGLHGAAASTAVAMGKDFSVGLNFGLKC